MAEGISLDDIVMKSEDLITHQKLDSGGYGLVSLCHHRFHGLVVLKTVYTGHMHSQYNEKLLEEGKIMHMLKNDRVVKLLGLILENGNYSLVMEYISNGNLLTVLEKVEVPLSVKARFILEIIEGMSYLHDKKVVHKDLKPENILVDEDFHIKIADLGVATFNRWSKLTKEQSKLQRKYMHQSTGSYKSNAGTLIYMAPEHLRSLNAKPTEKSDVFSFGIVVWVIFTNKEPYENALNEDQISYCVTKKERPSLEDLPEECPPEALDLMQQCWDDNPDSRPLFKECDCKFRPFYTLKQMMHVEKDVGKMKSEFERPNVIVERMASLQVDCVAEPPSIQPRDQPLSLHSSQGFITTNQVDESLFGPAPNEPIESEDPRQDETLERKLQNEMNYHQIGSRLDNIGDQSYTPKSSLEEKSKKVFNEPSGVNHVPATSGFTHSPFASNFENPPYLASHFSNWQDFYQRSPYDQSRGYVPVGVYGPTSSSQSSNAAWQDKNPTPESGMQSAYEQQTSHQFARDARTGVAESGLNVSISNSNSIQIGNNNTLSVISSKTKTRPEYISRTSNSSVEDLAAFECQTIVKDDHLQLLRENLSKKWKLFARHLGFREPEIDEIDHDYERDGLQEKVHQTLHKWIMKEGSKNATVGKVAKALSLVGESELMHALMNVEAS
ncbi:receptor interacting serine/threonine kinase 1 L homeolog isoform X1 [Xenopus laevis]|uniref:Receptor interacting serine/threonine kinase 1 L homeolog isoform X1 n=2 Tax=Xenopus laevis TaxID=8355 RepID=Q1ESX5_XENLA|nr:receptor interacting serine/threonine kinase 1 L homeolog isoform X1 [Xenopus laevis]XP_041421501.1 receptor interacting serine/threonine kinase 1 L homeolog isoform X1 [Xenopus laevis]XP_041421502.1 receptor interacting serine/threonine kinase 1 L homeolog isoform X1 [Xenopus laevis]BAE95197.1 receptor-interacting protein 1 [Xenopus laevis]